MQADGAAVETIEGLTESGAIADLQDAFHARNALQCGYCTPGMLVTAHGAAAARTRPRAATRSAQRSAGNYCRCTGYHAIVDAIAATAEAARDGPKNSRREAAA